MTEETTGKEVKTTTETAVAPVSTRLANLQAAKNKEKPKAVVELVGEAFAEGETGFTTDEFLGRAHAFFEKIGVLDEYLKAAGQEVSGGNISEWHPVLVGINSGKGKQAQELRHLDLNTLFDYGTKAALDVANELFYPVFIHGEEILKDESGMNVEDRIPVPYNSAQDAHTPGYDYQNVVFLLNKSLNEVYKISVKSSGHKFVTNILRNYMYRNYSKGIMFDVSALKTWMTMDVTEHTSKSGYKNPYARLTVATDEVSSDEAKVINIIQRKLYDDFVEVLKAQKEAAADEAETQALVDDNTTVDGSGDNFTQL